MRHSLHHTTVHQAALLLGVLTLSLALSVTTWGDPGLTPEAKRTMVLPVGRSVLLHFNRMKRVEVIEPEKVEVVVASLHDLSVYGRQEGDTTVYVWDKLGVHQIEVTITAPAPAETLVTDLRRVLGNRLTYTPSGDRVVVVEGVLPPAEADRAHQIIKATTTGEVQVVDLVRPEGTADSLAVQTAEALRRVLGEDLEYVVWNDKTVLVRGALGDQARLEQNRKVLEAATTSDVRIVDLMEYEEPQAVPPVEEIANAVGDRFQVWRVQGRTVAVDGTVASRAELDNLNKILQAFDTQAKVINLVQVVEPKPTINEYQALVQAALGDSIQVQPLNGNALVIKGNLATPEALADVRNLLANLDVDYQLIDTLRVAPAEKRRVLVRVRVIDVNRTEMEKLGVEHGQIAVDVASGALEFVTQPFWTWLEGGVDNVFDFGAQVDALVQNNLAKVLSEPNLLVDDGAQADILVGGEIPIPISSGGAGGLQTVTVEWKEFGVRLEVEPTILEGGEKLNLKVAPEVSSLDYGNAITIGGFQLPALRSRKATTEVTVADRQSLILGGLLQSTDAKTIRKIPLLGDIPIIGELFKHRDFQENKSELVIAVTPEIVKDDVQ